MESVQLRTCRNPARAIIIGEGGCVAGVRNKSPETEVWIGSGRPRMRASEPALLARETS